MLIIGYMKGKFYSSLLHSSYYPVKHNVLTKKKYYFKKSFVISFTQGVKIIKHV